VPTQSLAFGLGVMDGSVRGRASDAPAERREDAEAEHADARDHRPGTRSRRVAEAERSRDHDGDHDHRTERVSLGP
jgi:hypothetical protein